MNCDPIARLYQTFEYLAFGRELERRRLEFLPETTGCKRALVLGEGDGRFLRSFLDQNAEASVDYLDASAEMLSLARHRTGNHRERVRFHHADALHWTLPRPDYDLVVTHFFLDCFDQSGLALLIGKIGQSCLRAKWIVSDFHQPESGFRAFRASCWLRLLYALFRFATGLRVSKLPDHRPVLSANGFRLDRAVESEAGLLISELWIQDVENSVSAPTNS